MTPRWPPSLCVCTIKRFRTSLWDESLFSELPAGVCTSNARTSTDLYAQAQMQKVYKSTRPHIKHKEPLSDILNRWGCIPKHKCTVKRLLSEAELSKKKKKSLRAAGLVFILSIHTLSWTERKGSAALRGFCASVSFLWSSLGQVNWGFLERN